MISFRYHVVSLVAVLLALAIGIVLGGGPLQRDESRADESAPPAELTVAEQTIAAQDSLLAFGDSYAERTASVLLGDRLADRAVTMLMLPGAEEEVAGRIGEMVSEAGGEVTAQVDVSADLLDVGNRQLVDELGTQMYDDARKRVEVPTGVSGYERIGRLLAYALGTTRPEGEAMDRTSEGILAAVATAELVTTRGEVDRRGSLVVVVAGAPQGTADQRSGAGSVLASLVDALDNGTDGVVVTGPLAASTEDGLVAAVRTDAVAGSHVSTVDVADRVAGAVATVLALAEQGEGGSGHYGSAEAGDGALPVAGSGTAD